MTLVPRKVQSTIEHYSFGSKATNTVSPNQTINFENVPTNILQNFSLDIKSNLTNSIPIPNKGNINESDPT